MTILLILPLLLSNFVEKWYIPYGNVAPGGRILIYDTDHDEQIELIFRRWVPGSFGVYFAEFVPPDSWNIIESQTVDSVLIWDVGDFDGDALSDLATHGDASGGVGAPVPIIAIYESPHPLSYPTQEVWRDTVGQAVVAPLSVYDVDQDMLPEIIDNNGSGQPHWIWVYESTGNNQYDTVCTFNPLVDTFEHCFNSTHAFGDFDGDGSVEFVAGDLSGYYWVFESPSNNTYQQIHQGHLPTYNIKDCFSAPDADGDGKIEFVVKGYVISSAEIHAFIFEATGNNTYEIIKTFTLWGGDYYGGYSDVGDVDGDSIPEIALEGRQTVHIIKAAGNDSFYVWETLPGNASGSSVRLYDVDGNGISEVIISGNNETRIYEYQVGIEEAKKSPDLLSTFEVHPNPFTNVVEIRFSPQFTGEITVNVYDVSGRLIRNIYSGYIQGYETFTWLGDDNYGRQTPQGVYFVRIEYPDLEQTFCEKITRIK